MINRDVTKKSRRKVKAFFLLLIAFCMVLVSSFVTLAVEQSGNETVIKASSLQEDAALVLERDTVLNMDVDRTLKSIQGSTYLLYLEGSGTLTVDSDECAIEVYALTAEAGSNLTVICSDREEYCIQTQDTFTFGGANLNIDAYYGIKSDLGNIIIDASESATISTRKGYAVLVESDDKEYEVRGVEVTLLERKETLLASELEDHENIVLEDDTILVMDEEKTLGSISGAEYQLVIEGPNPLTFDTNRSAIYVQDLDVNTNLTVNSTCDNEYSIRVKNDININADNLIVDAVFGIKSDEGDIVIDVENHVEVYAEKGANIVSEGGAVYIWGQMIWLKNEMQGTDGEGREHGIYASDGVYVIGSGVNNIIVSGTYGIESGSEIRLSGNFTITSYRDAIHAQSAINLDGYFDVESTCRLKYDQFTDPDMLISIYSRTGTISMKGSKLKVLGERGIRTGGNIVIDCEEIDINATLANAVTASSGVALTADKIRITATYERYKEHQKDSDTPAFFETQWKYGRVVQGDTVKIDSQDAVIKGPTPVFADASGELSGDIRLFASGEEAGIKVFSGPLTLDGDIGIYVEVEDDHVTGIYAKQMKATGTGLYVTSTYGIYCMGDIDLNCDTISIQATAGDGIRTLNGGVLIDGGSLSIETAFDKEDLWDGGDCIGISAIKGVRLDCTSAEIYAPVGIQVSEGDVYLNGYSRIGSNEKGVYVDTGDIYINGYTRVGMLSGGSDPLRSEKKRIIVDPSLPMNYPAGGKIQAGPGRVLDSEDKIPEYVEFGSYVNDVNFNIDTPVGYNIIYTSGRIVRDLPEGLHVKTITWYCDGEKMELKYDGTNDMGGVYEYQAGKRYEAEVLLETDTQYLLGYGYNSDDTWKEPIVVNGDEPLAVGYTKTGKEIYVTYDFGTCPTGFYKVDLAITAPVDGQKPSTSVTAGSSGYGVRSENVKWMASNDGKDYETMNSGDTFIGGKFYKLIMEVTTPSPNYAFGWQTDPSGELLPRYLNYVYVNDARVEFSKIEGKDPLRYIEVSYDFGICNSSIIRKIEVVNVKEPRAGEHPNYEVSVRGTGYSIEQKNATYDAYWVNQEWYFIRNGVRWYDVTDGGLEDVYDQDTFILGHEYECVVYLQAKDGFEFLNDIYNDEFVEAAMNGQTAEVVKYGSGLEKNQQVSAVFSCDEYGSTSFTVSGDVTSAGSALDDVTIELYTESSGEPVYETTTRGTEASYTIYDVTPGTYTMKVSKPNHVEREYTVVVTDGNVVMDVKICCGGDITSDGNVDIGDHQALFEHLQGINEITDPYQLQNLDVNGDGNVDIGDHQALFEHLQGITPLY